MLVRISNNEKGVILKTETSHYNKEGTFRPQGLEQHIDQKLLGGSCFRRYSHHMLSLYGSLFRPKRCLHIIENLGQFFIL